MRAHIVLAHPEGQSLNGRLARMSEAALSERGWETTLSDLYAMGFDPCDRPDHYATRADPNAFRVETEQRFHAERGTTPGDVAAEVEKLSQSDLLIVHFPLWWFGMPAILKGWMDRVFLYGAVYRSTMRHDTGFFRGKKVVACVTTGASAEACSHSGQEGDTRMHLWPVLYSFRYVGFDVLQPEVLHGIGSAIHREDGEGRLPALDALTERWRATLESIETRSSISYNSDGDFDSTARLRSDAPQYSPFISHAPKI